MQNILTVSVLGFKTTTLCSNPETSFCILKKSHWINAKLTVFKSSERSCERLSCSGEPGCHCCLWYKCLMDFCGTTRNWKISILRQHTNHYYRTILFISASFCAFCVQVTSLTCHRGQAESSHILSSLDTGQKNRKQPVPSWQKATRPEKALHFCGDVPSLSPIFLFENSLIL